MRYLLTLLLALWCSVCLAGDVIWDGSEDPDLNWSTDANWSTGTKPGLGDVAVFDGGTSNNNCLLDDDHNALGIEVHDDTGPDTIYTGDIDLGNGAHTLTLGASGVVLAGSGIWDMGDCTLAVTGGPWTVNAHAGTWTEATSTVTFAGACTITGHNAQGFFHSTFASGSTITIHADTTARVTSFGTCTINGAVVLNDILAVEDTGDFVLNDGASFSGSSYLYLLSSNSGEGLTALHANVTTPDIQIWGSVSGSRFVAGTYAGLVKLRVSGASDATLELDNGTYYFNGGLELENTGSGDVLLDNSANDPTINVTDLTIDDQAGAVAITDTGAAVAWVVTGDMSVLGSGDTPFAWNKGTGDYTFSGIADQIIGSYSIDIGTWIINKSAGLVTLADAVLEFAAVDLVGNGSEALVATGSYITATADAKNFVGATANQAVVDFTDGSNSINLGAAPWTVTNGDWVTVGAGAWNRGTGTVAFLGTCTINTGTTNDFFNLTVTSGVTSVSTNDTDVNNICTINGTLSVGTGRTLNIRNTATVVVGDGGRLTGVGTAEVTLLTLASGKGVTDFHAGGTWDIPVTAVARPNAAAELAAGNYQSAVRVYSNSSTTDYTLTLDAAGAYQFDSLELETTGTNALTLDNTNGPTITVNGDFELDDQAGTIVVTSAATEVDFTITGDVITDGSGTITWTKGTGDITAQESPYLKNGGGFSFNGVDDEVDINAAVHNFATDFTIAAWVRVPAVTGASRAVFSQGANTNFQIRDNGALRYWTDGDATSTATGVLTANTWHHVMVTYDTSGTNEIVLYVDGATDPAWDEDKTATNTATDSRIGSYIGSTGWFDGVIADVRVWDKALSTAERDALWNGGAGTISAVAWGNTVGWWPMREAAANKTVNDNMGINDGISIQNTNLLRANYNQAWDWSELTGEIEAVVINKPFGTLTLDDDVDCTSWTHTDGTVEFNDVTITTTGNVTFSAGADGLATYLDGTTWTVGGAFLATGTSASSKLDMTATVGWTLDVAGAATASFVDVQNSNASGGSRVRATSSRNSGGNANWRFGGLTTYMDKDGRRRRMKVFQYIK